MAANPKGKEPQEAKVAIYVVRQPFVADVDGVPVAYRKGEPVEPGDPVLTQLGEAHFEPITFPHPIRRARMRAPGVRA